MNASHAHEGITLAAHYHDGRSARRHAVTLTRAGPQLHIVGDAVALQVTLAKVRVEPRLAGLPRMLDLMGQGHLEVDDHEGFTRLMGDLEPRSLYARVWRLERRWTLALAALAFTAGIVFAFLEWGLPWIAREVALRMPASTEISLGEQTLRALDAGVLEPSMVDGARVARLRGQLQEITGNADGLHYRLELRAAPGIGPNAFALPGGIIVFTDELLLLAKDERELLGVLAHEIGHVRRRHSLRHAIQNSGTTVIIALLTGDLLSASSWVAALPTFVLQARYSREFEREADRNAVELLHSRGVSPRHLADILRRMGEKMQAEQKSQLPGWLSTHPDTAERAGLLEGTSPLEIR